MEPDATLAARWETVVAELETVKVGPRVTLRPRTLSLEPETVDWLSRLRPAQGRVQVQERIAKGGMGVLHRAEQTTMGREVALKSVRADRVDARSTRKLLEEAWITGRLTHPNIVPVHDIEVMEGAPHVLMQEVEGSTWQELLRNAELVRTQFGAPDLLEWNVQTLMQVAGAIHYAHSRRIVHLDVKPENVMVGRFGQVYLLDWGIAASLNPQEAELPTTAKRRGMLGTPAYMAPEMVDSASGLSEATDIYLLGATLYEVLTGRPPHLADTLPATLHNVLFREPATPEDAPEELAAICARAMQADAGQRYASAEELRLALANYLRHRGSARLAEQAARKLHQLEALTAQVDAGEPAQDSPPAAPDPALRQRIHTLFSAARFGFQQALATWDENRIASHGLERVMTVMIEYELADGDPKAASNLAAEFGQSSPSAELSETLASRIQAALAELEAREAALSKLGRDYDLGIGQTTRLFVTLLFGAAAVVFPLLGDAFSDSATMQRHSTFIVAPLVFTVIAIGLGIWARESMTKTKVNFRYGLAVLFLLPAQAFLESVAWLRGDPAQTFVPAVVFMWFVVVTLLALMIEHRATPCAIGYGIAFVAVSMWPEYQFRIIAAANFVMMVNVTIMWWPEWIFRRG